jgi:hypothetical protein
MEPLMSFIGYQVIENSTKSNDLLNNFYQKKGYVVSDPAKTKAEVEIKKENSSVNEKR